MPFYDYDCAECGAFTAMRPMAAFADPTECPDCGAMAPRLMSAPLLGATAGEMPAAASAGGARHSGGCGCCAPRARKKLSAEAV